FKLLSFASISLVFLINFEPLNSSSLHIDIYRHLTASRKTVQRKVDPRSKAKNIIKHEHNIKSYKNVYNYKSFIDNLKNDEINTISSILPIATPQQSRAKNINLYNNLSNSLTDHLENLNSVNRNPGESSDRYVMPEFLNNIAPNIVRGIFKPNHKTFGFEVHLDHLEDMIRIMSSDCQLNNIGHEIPYLLNRVDEEIKRNFNSTILKERIAANLVIQSEELFFEEADERNLR
ncbi:MAG: hypothetical protein AAGI23_03250, partial [Bacteroidota bacterium]